MTGEGWPSGKYHALAKTQMLHAGFWARLESGTRSCILGPVADSQNRWAFARRTDAGQISCSRSGSFGTNLHSPTLALLTTHSGLLMETTHADELEPQTYPQYPYVCSFVKVGLRYGQG